MSHSAGGLKDVIAKFMTIPGGDYKIVPKTPMMDLLSATACPMCATKSGGGVAIARYFDINLAKANLPEASTK
jgi:hypothetical protein